MKKRSLIILTTAAITGLLTYFLFITEDKKTESIVIDKDGEIVKPLNGENDTIGHYCKRSDFIS
ncbi:hypothetical protein [Ornithinibacillus bavariensis]|uniref:Uncharacterized protein n=1 Tax=Ornithinibacillus bavariensis TaxID=545502 RepID=A0A920C5D4_9BACI|nr:hypothetical protein [Ornithinibacillus bavariensis]GIO26605.1 hypothetical protein J43TS3_12160 [Ornithinibacillus bavariensis]